MQIHNATLKIDESLGLTNASRGLHYTETELFPHPSSVGTWQQGQTVSVAVGGSNARVLSLKKLVTALAMPHQQHQQVTAAVVAAPLVLPKIYQAMPVSPDFNPSSSNTGGPFSTTFFSTFAAGQYEGRKFGNSSTQGGGRKWGSKNGTVPPTAVDFLKLCTC